jgi:hypothetical protein
VNPRWFSVMLYSNNFVKNPMREIKPGVRPYSPALAEPLGRSNPRDCLTVSIGFGGFNGDRLTADSAK